MVRRCSFCGVDWPDEDAFEACRTKGCGRKTWHAEGSLPDPGAERIVKARRHIEFEVYCAEKDAAEYEAALPHLHREIATLEGT